MIFSRKDAIHIYTFDLIVPCYNEAEVIEKFYKKVTDVVDNIEDVDTRLLFIDDGSTDNTLEIIKKICEDDDNNFYVSFSRNFGKESAMLAGFKLANADFVGIIDADLQHSPELIPDMLKTLIDEDYEVAAAKRTDRKGERRLKSNLSKGFYSVINKLSDTKIDDGAQDFRIMKRKVVNAILLMNEYNRFSKGIFGWVGYKTKWFAHENIERAAGKSKWSLFALMKYAIDGILSFSAVPLKIALIIGILSSIAGFIYAIDVIIRTIIYGSSLPGFPTLISAILIMGGLILVSLGIIGEYLSKMFIEIKHRPHFLIKETNIPFDKELRNNVTFDII